jgi:hypothetical protein
MAIDNSYNGIILDLLYNFHHFFAKKENPREI